MANKRGDETDEQRGEKSDGPPMRCLLLSFFPFAFPSFLRKPRNDDSEYAGVEEAPRSTSRSWRSSERENRGEVWARFLSLFLSFFLSQSSNSKARRAGERARRLRRKSKKGNTNFDFFFKIGIDHRFPPSTTLSISHLSSASTGNTGNKGPVSFYSWLSKATSQEARRGQELKGKKRRRKNIKPPPRHLEEEKRQPSTRHHTTKL